AHAQKRETRPARLRYYWGAPCVSSARTASLKPEELRPMLRSTRLWPSALVLAAIALLPPAALQAQTSKLLPADTEVVFTLSLRQMLDSPLAKKYILDHAKQAFDAFLQSNEDAKKALDSLGLDVFKDVDRLISTGTSADRERGIGIIEGRFNPAKWKAAAAE